jgi:hypothetical protein
MSNLGPTITLVDQNGNFLSTPAPSGGSTTGSGGTSVLPGFLELSGLSAAALNALLVPSTDVSTYGWWSLSIVSTALVGVLTWEASNDNFVSAPVTLYAYQLGVPSAYFPNNTNPGTGVQIFHAPVTYRYFRVRMTAYTSGSATAVLELHAEPSFAGSINAIQSGNWYVKQAQTNAPVAAGVGAANVVIKNAAGQLSTILVTSTSTAALQIFDNAATASGTVIGIVPSGTAVGTTLTPLMPAANGITAGQVAGSAAVTVGYI